MIIDTHVHLNDPKLYQDLDLVVKEAYDNDVKMMIVSGYDKKSSLRAIEIAKKYDNVYANIGIHPSEVHKASSDLGWLEEGLEDPKVIGIGEIGLDLYWDTTYKDLQIEFFKNQIRIAQQKNYPIVVHSRKASNETYEVLKTSNVKGIMHCYAYNLDYAKKFIDLGFLIGIGGVVTFKNASLKEVVRDISLDNIVTETDSPYLAPTPHRGKTNYPKYTKLVVEEIARIKQVDVEDVKTKIFNNVSRMFFKESLRCL